LRGRFPSRGERVGMLLLQPRDLCRRKFSTFWQRRMRSRDECIGVAQMSVLDRSDRLADTKLMA